MRSFLKKCALGTVVITMNGFAASDFMEAHLNSFSRESFESSKIDGYLGGSNNEVSDKVGNVPGNRYFGEFEFDYHDNVNTKKVGVLEDRFHVAAIRNDEGLTMYSVQEAYIGMNFSEVHHVRIGRQILGWSAVDAVWGFGKVNNRRNFTGFTPGQEGLIGIAYELKPSSGFRFKGFASGLYVPETNPTLDVSNKRGTITSRSPWADAPASRANVEVSPGNVVAMDVKYHVNNPALKDVVYRATVGANIGWENNHWVFDNFVMRKPENTFTPSVDVNVDFGQNVINANITPKFYYHDVYGSTLKYRNQDIEMYVSGIAVRPNEFPDVNPQVRYTEIKNRKRREDYVGGGISRSNDIFTLAFNYVARLSPFDRLKDDLAPDPRWNQALNFFASRNFNRYFAVSGDLKYDMLTTDRLFMLRSIYNVTRDFQLNAGVNMIGTPTNGKSYWSPYTNNDAIYGGLRYVY